MFKAIAASGLVLTLVWASLTPAQDQPKATPQQLLSGMAEALTSLNYEGNFVHLQGNNIESMSIVHANIEGGEMEYMLSLNGEAREVFRDRSLVTCIWPDSKSVFVSESKSRNILPNVEEVITDSEHYDLALAEPDRVAGRDTFVVNVKPTDNFRYGYRFWVDKENNMLLRSMLVDSNDMPIEQVMFTEISYPNKIEKTRFDTPGNQIETFTTSTAQSSPYDDDENRVSFIRLPTGYAEISETYQPRPLEDGPMSHVMLSDGMASVSVYVEFIPKEKQADVLKGMSTMGAMNAYTKSIDKALITVVGEVPSTTVESIANAVQLAE